MNEERREKEKFDKKGKGKSRRRKPGNTKPNSKSCVSSLRKGEDTNITAKVVPGDNNAPDTIPTRNDEKWYDNDGLLGIAGKVSFANALGDTVDLSTADYPHWKKGRFPGVFVMDGYTGVGYSNDNTSPVNIAAQELYTKVRSVQSSAARYGKQDLMMYYITIQQAHNMYWNGVRALGVSNFVNKLNRYTPWYMSEALGIDIAGISKEANRFANILNLFAKKIASYAIPANFDYANRQRYVYSRIFVDAIDAKSKFYMVRPAGYFTFQLDDESKGMLKWNDLTANYASGKFMSIDEYAQVLDNIAQAFVGDEDMGQMSGDIMKTFPNSLVGWEPIDANIIVSPVYDPMTLTSIHNATIIGNVLSGDITQNPDINKDYIVCDPVFEISDRFLNNTNDHGPLFGKRIIDLLPGMSGTPGEIAEATRFTAIPTVYAPSSGTKGAKIDEAAPVDIVTGGWLYWLETDDNNNTTIKLDEIGYQTEINTDSTMSAELAWEKANTDWKRIGLLTQFIHAPITMHVASFLNNNTKEFKFQSTLVNQVSNYAVVDKQFLNELNKVCVLSLFSTKNL